MTVSSVAKTPIESGAGHPVAAAEKCRTRRKQRLGDAVGITQFGVNRVEIDPGVWSTVRHWHSHEDEFVLVIEGELTLVTDDETRILQVGDITGFPAGVADGHRLENRADAMAVYLEVGSRLPNVDEVTYSDDDLLVRPDADGRQMYYRKDGTLVGPAD